MISINKIHGKSIEFYTVNMFFLFTLPLRAIHSLEYHVSYDAPKRLFTEGTIGYEGEARENTYRGS